MPHIVLYTIFLQFTARTLVESKFFESTNEEI